MRLVADADRVWMDAGPFFRFCEVNKLAALAKYVGHRGCWVVDVANEIELRASSPIDALRTHPRLQNLSRLGFPIDQRGATLAPKVNARSPRSARTGLMTVTIHASTGARLRPFSTRSILVVSRFSSTMATASHWPG